MSDSASKSISIRIAIDIPADVAAETLARLQPALAAMTNITNAAEASANASLLQDEADEARKAEIKAHYDEQKLLFEKNAVQAFRMYRRIVGDYDKPSATHRVIAERFQWPVGIVASVLSTRRKKVTAYCKKRQLATVLRLAYLGYTNQKMADAMGISQPTANRLLREARKAKAGGRANA